MIFFIGWIISLIVICWLYYYPKKKVEKEHHVQGMKGPIGIPYSAKRNPILPIDSRIILKDTSLIDSTFYIGMPVMVNGKHVILKNKNC